MRLVVILLILTFPVHAQKRSAPPPARAKSAAPAVLTTPFDVTLKNLPVAFEGHDIKALYTALSQRQSSAEKGEFETTQEFNERVRQLESAPLMKGLPLDSILAFNIRNSSGEAVYDADAQAMTFALALHTPTKDYRSVDSMRNVTVEYDLDKSKYEASNAMGAKIQVESVKGKEYGLAFENYRDFGMKRYLNSITRKLGYTSDIHKIDALVLEIGMDIPTAKRAKENLTALAVVRLVPPYTFKGTFYDKPTFNNPKEYFVQYFYLNVELLEVWVYDSSTGEVLAKAKNVK